MEYKLATSSWDNKEIEAIQAVIKTGHYSMGEKVQEFELLASKLFGSKYSVMCSSGSTANLLMIAALFYTKIPLLRKGDEVIVPAVSWSTTYFPLYQYGLKIKFVDIDIETLNFDLNELKKAISPRTKMILAVNLLGNSNDYSFIKDLIEETPIILIEDNCESMGAKFNNRFTGTFGLMGSFSTFFSHHISTMEGGFITTNNEELYHILLCLRAHGWTRNLPLNNHITQKNLDDFDESFRFILPGYNVRPLEFSGAIGIEQLKKLPSFIEKRRENAKYFKKLFKNDQRFILQKELGKSSWFGFSLIINDERIKRDDLVKLFKEAKIECRPIVSGNFAKKEVVKYFDYEIHSDLKNANNLDSNGLFVGNSHLDLKKEIDFLKTTLDKGL